MRISPDEETPGITPGFPCRFRDSHPARGLDLVLGYGRTLGDEQRRGRRSEVGPVQVSIDRQPGTQSTRSAQKLPILPTWPSDSYRLDPLDGSAGADQHGSRESVSFGHQIEAVVHAVNEVDVSGTRRPVHDLISPGLSRCSVAGLIVLTHVGLCFHDLNDQFVFFPLPDEIAPEKLFCHL